ncbi:exopolyphosphatase/guanosine-5'-triphosphate,3'-diphosphate pyrophosphatase [Solirubrobacter pauli]|uniref:Exopolyphosphatase/guanosine-5'-triphosphate, 3'-diphosphate pyrophosphatase n=1 Tax=Solirubrobacter pauli TaxID=166793 RepID=A0A660LCP9_9ACTN|nr:Ppx/GppA family phosphatase [Solirubrobacter pauli]RKQ91650.1 exopolyphosphatase/guanosine-5'-triphosphate,3'-diphosphate pyrophosphatase [Solirubrobacter pauli]
MKRVAAVDIGTNSTRLLITDGTRRSTVTRLGEGVDATGRLGEAPMQRVLDVLADYARLIGDAPAAAVMTSAVRDAENGAAFAARVHEALGFPARILSGDEEAELTFTGATAQRDDRGPVLVIDIGGGSTELVIGEAGRITFHVSTQIGVVRHGERHLRSDPPAAAELAALRADIRLPDHPAATRAIAVAGTPTQCAAIDLGLEEYDPERIEGHVLTRTRLEALYADLASKPLTELRKTRGLDPARAPVIVAGIAILLEVMGSFGLDQVEASEHDILYGLALSTAADAP